MFTWVVLANLICLAVFLELVHRAPSLEWMD
jgi:hypothetical protein